MNNIQLSGIRKSYGKKEILKGVSLEIPCGKCVGILGGNGSGKSTLLSILAGVTKKDAGEFLCDGENLFEKAAQAKQIGYVPQGIPLFEELTAKENLMLWYTPDRLKESLNDGVLKMLGIPEFLKVKVSKMSGGMKKRLSIGCAVCQSPKILLLDEPSAALDLLCKEKVLEYLDDFRKKQGIVILATHDMTEIEFCDSLYILKNGVLTPFDGGDIHQVAEAL